MADRGARPQRKIHIPEVLNAMLNVDQSGCKLLPISPGSSSRVMRQTKEDPGGEVARLEKARAGLDVAIRRV